MVNTRPINAVLFDLDGVFYVGHQPLPGAIATLDRLRDRQMPCRFLTNTTTKTRQALHQTLQGMGLDIPADEIISAPYAAVLYLRQLGYPRCHLLLAEEVKAEFAEFQTSAALPEVIVVGDIGDRWTYDLMNQLFQQLMAGAQLLALHKGKFWQTATGLQLDVGAFIAGLEYATGKAATLIGKPAPAFFQLALQDLGLTPQEVLMVGDDVEADVGGAQQVGMRGVLVQTGKYRADWVARSAVRPDNVLPSIAAIPDLLFGQPLEG